MPVNTARSDYVVISPKWERLRDCFNGRDAILRAGSKYVPDLPGADVAGNAAYRFRGNFYNALSRTVVGMSGSIFQRSPEVNFPSPFEDLLDDVTLTNVPFEMFAVEAGIEVVLLSRYGILVDMPSAEGSYGGAPRPYLIGYRAEDIINWKTVRRGGDEVLTMVVLREVADVGYTAEDPFQCVLITQYRVVGLVNGKCVVQLWREDKPGSGKWVLSGPVVTLVRRGTPLDFVPFVFIPGPDLQTPPLLDLADVNLGHWRNSVDHEYGLHLVALPTPWVAGSKGSALTGEKMKIGPSVVWELELQGSAGMLEFTGEGLAAIVTAMGEKKKQMASLGARLLEDVPAVSETAAAVRLRHSGEQASLRMLAGQIELGYTAALQLLGWWVGTAARPTEVEAEVELNKEYLNVKASPQEIQVALTALQAGEISYLTWYHVLSTGGWTREGVDAEKEQETIRKEGTRVPEPPEDMELSPVE